MSVRAQGMLMGQKWNYYVMGQKWKYTFLRAWLHLEKKKKKTTRIKIFDVLGIIWTCKRTWDMKESSWIIKWIEERLKLTVTSVKF